MRLSRPHAFQGNLNRQPYFEGWYFKLVDRASGLSLCLIPGVSLAGKGDDHGFIQYADTITGTSGYIKYPLETLQFSTEVLDLNLDGQVFTDSHIRILPQGEMPYGIDIAIDRPKALMYPTRRLHPTIMGPFSFMPFMECYHHVHMVWGRVRGTVSIGNKRIEIHAGELYIEKDWGRSFPSEWIWIEAGGFVAEDPAFEGVQRVHVMLSVANIPWLRGSFNGHLGYVWIDDLRIDLGTYCGSAYTLDILDEKSLNLVLTRGKYHIVVGATQQMPIKLIAPNFGEMKRYVEEDLAGHIALEVYEDGQLIYRGEADYCGFERCGDIGQLGQDQGTTT